MSPFHSGTLAEASEPVKCPAVKYHAARRLGRTSSGDPGVEEFDLIVSQWRIRWWWPAPAADTLHPV